MRLTCLHCHRALPSNDAVEALPYGRRVAYDPAESRYWIVCARCRRWSLAPLDDAGPAAAIEQLERWWRGTTQHYTSGGIGIGSYSPRLEVVRVGSSNWPEFAAWRHGRTLVMRGHWWRAQSAVTLGILGGIVAASGVLLLPALSAASVVGTAPGAAVLANPASSRGAKRGGIRSPHPAPCRRKADPSLRSR